MEVAALCVNTILYISLNTVHIFKPFIIFRNFALAHHLDLVITWEGRLDSDEGKALGTTDISTYSSMIILCVAGEGGGGCNLAFGLYGCEI